MKAEFLVKMSLFYAYPGSNFPKYWDLRIQLFRGIVVYATSFAWRIYREWRGLPVSIILSMIIKKTDINRFHNYFSKAVSLKYIIKAENVSFWKCI